MRHPESRAHSCKNFSSSSLNESSVDSPSEKGSVGCVPIPMQCVGPLRIITGQEHFDTMVPLATLESPLFPSVARGARATLRSGGIRTVLLQDAMARSIVFETVSLVRSQEIVNQLEKNKEKVFAVAESTSRFLRCTDLHFRIVGNQVFLRLSGFCGDASGHNMITKACEHLLQWICRTYTDVKYVSVSGNFCTDKKVSAVNGILGRGKSVCAEVVLPEKICRRYLKTTPERVVALNTSKNFLGSIVNGGTLSANAHFANMLFAIYLATGQDVANIVEGSQGITFAKVEDGGLYFSVNLPNIIVGTVGNGKDLPFAKAHLEMMGCLPTKNPGESSQKLAQIVAATVLCGELSLLAAQTNPGELVKTHMDIERKGHEGRTT